MSRLTPDMEGRLRALAWSTVISPGTYPTSRRPTKSTEGQPIRLDYAIRLSHDPVTFGLFEAYLADTERQPVVPRYASTSPADPLTRVYCTEVVPFCRWLDQWCRAHRLLESGWRVDLPLVDEWIVGCHQLFVGLDPPSSVKIGPYLLEWCWRITTYLWKENLPEGYADWRKVTSWFSLCAIFGNRPAYFSDLYPTWEDSIGFRLVCRQ